MKSKLYFWTKLKIEDFVFLFFSLNLGLGVWDFGLC